MPTPDARYFASQWNIGFNGYTSIDILHNDTNVLLPNNRRNVKLLDCFHKAVYKSCLPLKVYVMNLRMLSV